MTSLEKRIDPSPVDISGEEIHQICPYFIFWYQGAKDMVKDMVLHNPKLKFYRLGIT